jgi:hypothetical protein
LIRRIRFVVDQIQNQGQALATDIARVFGEDSVRKVKNHAKALVIQNESWNVLACGSANFNNNPRTEVLIVADDPGWAGMARSIVDTIFGETSFDDGVDGSSRLPQLRAMDAVSPVGASSSGQMLEKTRSSVTAAVAAGKIDSAVSAGPIEALLKLAEQLDSPDWPLVGHKLDTTTPQTYLRYAETLGLTPSVVTAEETRKAPADDSGGLAKFRAASTARRAG